MSYQLDTMQKVIVAKQGGLFKTKKTAAGTTKKNVGTTSKKSVVRRGNGAWCRRGVKVQDVDDECG